MFWAAFGWGIRTRLVPMNGDPDSPKGGVSARVYQSVLNQYLPPIFGFGNIFMQDNAPIHKAHIIRDWFRERGYEVMVWPPYSPDLNPIENLWALLKAEIYRLYPELLNAPNNAETLDLLIRAAMDTWERLGEDLFNTLIDTMERRVKAVVEAEGWYTKY
jgi:transposase